MQPFGRGAPMPPPVAFSPITSAGFVPNMGVLSPSSRHSAPPIVAGVSMVGVTPGSSGHHHRPGIRVGMTVPDGKGKQFRVDKELGAGCFGSVFKMQRSDGKIVAVKVQPLTAQMEEIRKEIRLLKTLRHDNIVSFFDDFNYTVPGSASAFVLIVMEFCGGGTLQHAIKKRKATGGYRSHEIFAICAQLADGLAFIHKSNVTHRDLKSENIMLTADDIIKISDFGRGRFMHHGQAALTATSGDRMVIPPEFMNKAMSGQMGVVGPKYDCWGLGCILSELLTLQLLSLERCQRIPLGGDMNALRQLLSEARKLKGGQFSKLLEGLLAPDPNARFSSKAVNEALANYLAALKQQNEQNSDKDKQFLAGVIAKAEAWGVDAAECQRLYGLFRQVDKAGTGKISVTDLQNLLVLLGITASARWVIQSIDTNHDNAVDFVELVKWWGQRDQNWVPPLNANPSAATGAAPAAQPDVAAHVFSISKEIYEKISAAFRVHDPDNSGTIAANLLYSLLLSVGLNVTPTHLPAIMQSVGPNPEETELRLEDVLYWWKNCVSEESMTLGKYRVGDTVECKRSSGAWALAKVTKVGEDFAVSVEFIDGSGTKELGLQFYNGIRRPSSQNPALSSASSRPSPQSPKSGSFSSSSTSTPA